MICARCGESDADQTQANGHVRLHENDCPRFQCSQCGVRFAILPDPLKKRFGEKPLCRPCKDKQLPPNAQELKEQFDPDDIPF